MVAVSQSDASSNIVDRTAAICLLDEDVGSVQGVRRGLDLVAVHVTDEFHLQR